jgi:protein-S-isoprenylcysteine O-methyltransferase Ste14
LLALGVSVLMPPGGAAFFLAAFSVFTILLVRAEERFLSVKQGNVYQQYRLSVPRFWPRMPAGKPAPFSGRPRWAQALLAETYPVAITLCFGVLAWRYNARILVQCVLICYGVSLVVRALAGERPEGRV